MEKGTPHCPLARVKELVREGCVRWTLAAAAGAQRLGLTDEDMVGVVLALQRTDFHKSMTTYADHRVWQDVYRPITRCGPVYLKFTVVDHVLIVSFKEL